MVRHRCVLDQNRRRFPSGLRDDSGFSLVEMMIGAMVLCILAGFVSIILGNLAGHYKLSGDARGVSNSAAVAKLRAASLFTKTRLYATLAARTYQIQTWQKTGTPGWVTEGGATTLSSGVTFGVSGLATPPPNTQATIAQAAPCKDAANADIAGTSCILFNSRGLPVDSTGAPTGIGALYLTDGQSVYGITVSATGMVRFWRSVTNGTSSWAMQ
jgi:prepilin-type N-terminal cleavage/methylation domain-containing protein